MLWYLRIPILEPELARARRNRTRDATMAEAGEQTTRQLSKTVREQRKKRTAPLRRARSRQRARRAQGKFARRHSESTSTRTILAEGSPSSRQIRTAPQPERFDAHDLGRGLAELKANSHGAAARALRSARSWQRARRAQGNSHGATARALRRARSWQRARRAQGKFARRHSQSASTRTILAEGSPSSRQIRTAPQREHFEAHDLGRGLAELKANSHGATARALRRANSHGATARALRRARSRQRARRAQGKFARRHSESASTRTMLAEGSLSSRQIRTAPQPERFDAHDLGRGLAELKANSHGATARAIRRARSWQRARRAQGKFARRHSFDTHDLRRGFAELKAN